MDRFGSLLCCDRRCNFGRCPTEWHQTRRTNFHYLDSVKSKMRLHKTRAVNLPVVSPPPEKTPAACDWPKRIQDRRLYFRGFIFRHGSGQRAKSSPCLRRAIRSRMARRYLDQLRGRTLRRRQKNVSSANPQWVGERRLMLLKIFFTSSG